MFAAFQTGARGMSLRRTELITKNKNNRLVNQEDHNTRHRILCSQVFVTGSCFRQVCDRFYRLRRGTRPHTPLPRLLNNVLYYELELSLVLRPEFHNANSIRASQRTPQLRKLERSHWRCWPLFLVGLDSMSRSLC